MPVLLEIGKEKVVVTILADKTEKSDVQPKPPPGVQCLGTTKRGRCRHSSLAAWTSKRDRASILATERCTFHQE
jgi:hypothetical protein